MGSTALKQAATEMRILIVDTFYGPYLQRIYVQGGLGLEPWKTQHKTHFQGGFGTGDAYSHGLSRIGAQAIEIVANSPMLQRAWAKEYRAELLGQKEGLHQLLAILAAQIQWWKPTVLYVQDINWLPAGFIQQVKPNIQLVVGQNACPLARNLDLSPYDLMLTSLPHYVGKFRSMGVRAEYFPIGFDERLLKQHKTDGERPHLVSFVGGLGGFHSQGTSMLESIAKAVPLKVWGYGGEELPEGSKLKMQWQGEAWAEEMYGLLSKSKITINRHIDIAQNYANNMRLYEATGMGACLVTDKKINLPNLFEPDFEVVTYSSAEEAIEKIKYLATNPDIANKIATNGQKRTLRQHTYARRMNELVEILRRHTHIKNSSVAKRSKKVKTMVACGKKNINRIPNKLRRALRMEHNHHILFLISDETDKNSSLRGVNRWNLSPLQNEIGEIETCLEAMDVDHILIIEEEKEAVLKDNWAIKLKKKADELNIVNTFMRPEK